MKSAAKLYREYYNLPTSQDLAWLQDVLINMLKRGDTVVLVAKDMLNEDDCAYLRYKGYEVSNKQGPLYDQCQIRVPIPKAKPAGK
jgi:hypothetical protein